LSVAEIDRLLGIQAYITKTEGVGGKIRENPENFVVEELLVDGSKAQVHQTEKKSVIGSSSIRQRHILCVMVKRNWDTFLAVKKVAAQLGLGQNSIQIAGIKDAKAVTAQYVSVENFTIEEISKVDVKGITIHPIGYLRNPLSLFYLLGNNFTIKITGINYEESFTKERTQQIVSEINQIGGIPNFYGHQRFGTTRPITHLVGKAILQGKFEEAAMIFLAKPSSDEHPESRQVRIELQKTRDFEKALDHFPKQLRYERSMLTYLIRNPTDFPGSFHVLPLKLQGLFVQAYQSFLFNRFLSERINNNLSLNIAEVGDFVVGVERSGLPMVNMAKTVAVDSLVKINEALADGKVRVALPIVGFRQKLSDGVMGELEKKVLQEEAVELDRFRITANSNLGGRGGLRTALTPVKDFRLNELSANSVSLSFNLFRGCYATILLREIIKPVNPIEAGF